MFWFLCFKNTLAAVVIELTLFRTNKQNIDIKKHNKPQN